jgi:DNA processing protein
MTTRTSIEIRTIHGEDLHNLLRDESARTEYAPLRIRGEIPDGKAPILCVEGARAASRYGIEVARQIGAELTHAGAVVITGAGYGIGEAVLRSALEVGGRPIVVLASGADRIYPAAHADLINETAFRGGCVISPFLPGLPPSRHRFAVRNRLIAHIANAVVIIEAAARSTTRDLVTYAEDLGRPLLATPGPITGPFSALPHRLIHDGRAQLATGATDILAAL